VVKRDSDTESQQSYISHPFPYTFKQCVITRPDSRHHEVRVNHLPYLESTDSHTQGGGDISCTVLIHSNLSPFFYTTPTTNDNGAYSASKQSTVVFTIYGRLRSHASGFSSTRCTGEVPRFRPFRFRDSLCMRITPRNS
jgi:hypothetical protein